MSPKAVAVVFIEKHPGTIHGPFVFVCILYFIAEEKLFRCVTYCECLLSVLTVYYISVHMFRGVTSRQNVTFRARECCLIKINQNKCSLMHF